MKDHNHQIYMHSIKVADMAVHIGQKCGLTQCELIELHFGAFFHDIGKLGIPPEILYKPESLTESEWEIIKKHPIQGREILENKICTSNENILDAVFYHHARYDGEGYPDDINGEDIPTLARFIAVADAMEAMVSRPYKATFTYKQVIRELKDCAGTQFDPNIIKNIEDMNPHKVRRILKF